MSEPNSTLPRYQRTVLDNGVRVVTESIPSVRSLSVGAWVACGSRDETDAEAGICHFIEHMVFKGTRRRRMHQIAHRMEAVGGYLNAFTSKEYTCYYARALDEHLGRAIDVVTDLILRPTFPEREIEKEKDVVVEEMKMYEDAPEDLAFDHYESLVYDGHALGRPIIGFEETVRSFDPGMLHGFLEARYTPAQIVLAVSGNVRHEQAVRFARKAFADVDRAPRPFEREAPGAHAPATREERKPVQQAHLVMGTRAYAVDDPRRISLSVLNTLLGGGMSSRLNQNIREKHGYCYNIYSFVNQHSDTGDFGVYLGLDARRVDRARVLVRRELDRLADTPVSARTLQRTKSQVKGALMLGLENTSHRMMRLGRAEMYHEPYMTLDEIVARIDAVTADDVQAVARELFHPERFSEVVLLPEGAA